MPFGICHSFAGLECPFGQTAELGSTGTTAAHILDLKKLVCPVQKAEREREENPRCRLEKVKMSR